MELSLLKERMERAEPLAPIAGRSLAFECGDRVVADAYVERISEVYGLPRKPCDSVADAARESSSAGFFPQPRLFVVRDDPKAQSSPEQFLSACVGDDMLILVFDGPAKQPFARAVGEALVPFRRIARNVMAGQIVPSLAKGLSPDRAEALSELCDDDYGRVSSEADKVARLSAETGRPVDWAFDILRGTGQLGVGPMNDRYHFANSFVLGSKDTFDACYGVDPLELISLLYAQCRSMYLALCNADSPEPCKATGMSYAQFKAYRYKRHSIRTGDLIAVMGVLQKAERGIKNGTMPKEVAMKYVMAKAFGYAIR